MAKEEIVQYLEDYARSFNPPLREGILVSNLRADDSGALANKSSRADYFADEVVVATGGYHVETIPRIAERFPPTVKQLHSAEYRNPGSLPAGEVLVIGSGQSGCQIAEDLHLAGRQVHLCVGGAPRTARRYRGKDVVVWLHQMGYYNMPVNEHPLKDRLPAQATPNLPHPSQGHNLRRPHL